MDPISNFRSQLHSTLGVYAKGPAQLTGAETHAVDTVTFGRETF